MELRPAKNNAEYGNETGKSVMTKVFQRLLRSLLRITAAFHPTHRENIMDHFQESLDYLSTAFCNLSSTGSTRFVAKCLWESVQRGTNPCDLLH
eukprot:g82594.t1